MGPAATTTTTARVGSTRTTARVGTAASAAKTASARMGTTRTTARMGPTRWTTRRARWTRWIHNVIIDTFMFACSELINFGWII